MLNDVVALGGFCMMLPTQAPFHPGIPTLSQAEPATVASGILRIQC
jgi:hypothetical protein